jgi:tRNA uridine 5-carboxymethylaminomethyl modification enzyme
VSEPYRMFTSRAEFRLHLRSDNADQRLTQLGIDRGLVGTQRAELFVERRAALGRGRAQLSGLSVTPPEAKRVGIAVNGDGQRRSAFDLLSYPTVTEDDVIGVWPELGQMPRAVLKQLAIDARYAVYLDRQQADIAAVKRDESREIPDWVDYAAIPGLSAEVRQKLAVRRPGTIAQAQAIDGVTPAAITLILSILRRGSLRKTA